MLAQIWPCFLQSCKRPRLEPVSGARDPSHTPAASNPSAQCTAASLLCACSKALALACPFTGGFLGRAQPNLIVTVDRGQGWEHVMDAICVLLVALSCAKVTHAAPCLCWDWGLPPAGGTGAQGGCGAMTEGTARCAALQGTPWWAAKLQPCACGLSAGKALKTSNCFQPQEK